VPTPRTFPARATLGTLGLAGLAWVAAWVAATLAVSASPDYQGLDNPASVARTAVIVAAYAAGTAVLLARLPAVIGAPLSALGLRALRASDVGAVAGGVLATVFLRLAAFAYLAVIGASDHVQTGLEGFHVDGVLSATLSVAVAATIVPFCEELLFRGVIYGALASRATPFRAAVASGLVFAASRGDLVLFPFFALYGTLLAVLYRRTGNLWVPILVRGIFDGASVALLVYLDLH
jgi:membrane protease YdiL (CAAX protease family)